MKFSDREWTVLAALWEADGAELGELTEALQKSTGWNRNTLLTYLTRMETKGAVRIDKEVYPHRYYAAVEEEDCRAKERRSFLERVYHGAAGELVAAFLKEEPISASEREALRALLDEMEP